LGESNPVVRESITDTFFLSMPGKQTDTFEENTSLEKPLLVESKSKDSKK